MKPLRNPYRPTPTPTEQASVSCMGAKYSPADDAAGTPTEPISPSNRRATKPETSRRRSKWEGLQPQRIESRSTPLKWASDDDDAEPDGSLPGWPEYGRFPGSDPALSDCGQIRGYIACPKTTASGPMSRYLDTAYKERHRRSPIQETCGSRDCEVCWTRWAQREGRRASDRIEGARRWAKDHGHRLVFRHVILSPDQDEWIASWREDPIQAERDLRREASRVARHAGLIGGYMAVHPYREEYDRRRDGAEKYHGGGLRLGPHVHVQAPGYLKDADDFYRETGWVYKNKGKRRVSSLVRYLLGHAVVRPGRHAITWWGALSYTNMTKSSEVESWVRPSCHDCDSPCVYQDRDGTVRGPAPLERDTFVTYHFKTPPHLWDIERRRALQVYAYTKADDGSMMLERVNPGEEAVAA